jgi:hypothetical protein
MLQLTGSGAYSRRMEDGVYWKRRPCTHEGTDIDLWTPRCAQIRNWQSNLIPDALAGVCGEIAVVICAYERNVDFKMFSDEETLATNPIVAHWVSFSKNAALGAHTYIENWPELLRSSAYGRRRRS